MANPTLPLIFTIAIFLMLLNLASSQDWLSFNFNSFKQEDKRNIILQGDARFGKNVLQITRTDKNEASVGRALHVAQVHLSEKSTNKLANFDVRFSFSLRTRDSDNPADGLAFFIAPADTAIPRGSDGGLLGLFEPDKAQNASANKVVAVEFDTFTDSNSNEWDPDYPHIGIDVNSIRSVKTIEWERREGEILEVIVKYSAFTKTLAVVATYPDGEKYELSYEVDLAQVLPEYVRVGFSAATGYEFQFHTLRSWFFSSTLVNPRREKNEYIVLPREM